MMSISTRVTTSNAALTAARATALAAFDLLGDRHRFGGLTPPGRARVLDVGGRRVICWLADHARFDRHALRCCSSSSGAGNAGVAYLNASLSVNIGSQGGADGAGAGSAPGRARRFCRQQRISNRRGLDVGNRDGIRRFGQGPARPMATLLRAHAAADADHR